MGMFDDALKKSVPGGNLTKPLVIAAGALILAKWLGGKGEQKAQPEIMPPERPQSVPQSGGRQPQTIDINHSDENLPGGLGGLLEKLRNGGQADKADSWVSTGPNKPIEPGALGSALGKMTVSELAQKAGTTEEDILEILTQVLPQLVDNLTPQGRLPTQADVANYGRRG